MKNQTKKQRRTNLGKARTLVSMAEEPHWLGLTELAEQKEELAVSMQTRTVGRACFSAIESQQLVQHFVAEQQQVVVVKQ